MAAMRVAMILVPLLWSLLIGALLSFVVPDLTRPDLFFGVTVDPGFRNSPLGRAIRRRYGIVVWIVTLLAITAAALLASAPPAVRGLPWVLQIVASFGAFVWAYRATRPHAGARSPVVTVELSAKAEPTSFLLPILAAPIASLAILGVWVAFRWRDVPTRLAVHWGFAGPDRWVSTTPGAVAKLLGLHAGLCLFLALLAIAVLHGSRRIATAGDAAGRERRFRMRTVSLLGAAEYFAVFPAWIGLLGLPAAVAKLWAVCFLAALIVLVARIALNGQGGTRGLPGAAGAVGDRTDDRHWKWGLLYFNRDDPAFLVEKRFGIGYTFNFAHPLAWGLLALLVVILSVARFL